MSPRESRRFNRPAPTPGRGRALVGFAAFGWFWGTFGASLPAVKAHADVSEGALGVALLCVGMGALTSMRPMGAIVDRFGGRVLPASVLVFAATALLPAVAGSAFTLSGALLLLGAGSGRGRCRHQRRRSPDRSERLPLMNLAHALFSAGVVGASLLTGLLRGLDADLAVVLGARRPFLR